MARKPRIHIPGGLYHVIFRGNGGQTVFLGDEDRFRFSLLLQEGTVRFGYRVHAFCLMTNHIHLALQCGDLPLQRGMQNLSFRYTRWINWRTKRTGHLFQGRYKAVLVDSDSYLLELVRYIHLNPVRAGMVKVPGDYQWSSHHAYLGKETLPWLTTEWALGQFGKSTATARSSYGNFVLDGLGEGHRPEFHGKGETDSRLLGDDSFLEKCLAGSDRLPLRLSAQEIVAEVCRTYAIDDAVIKTVSQNRKSAEARAAAGWLTKVLGCGTLSEVGMLVNRDVGSMSSAVRRLSDRMVNDPQLAIQIEKLKAVFENKLSILEA